MWSFAGPAAGGAGSLARAHLAPLWEVIPCGFLEVEVCFKVISFWVSESKSAM